MNDKEKMFWICAIIITMYAIAYMFVSSLNLNSTFTTGSIQVETLTKHKIEKLCNVTLVYGEQLTFLDNTSRNSFGPYTDGSVVCLKGNATYDFILNNLNGDDEERGSK